MVKTPQELIEAIQSVIEDRNAHYFEPEEGLGIVVVIQVGLDHIEFPITRVEYTWDKIVIGVAVKEISQ